MNLKSLSIKWPKFNLDGVLNNSNEMVLQNVTISFNGIPGLGVVDDTFATLFNGTIDTYSGVTIEFINEIQMKFDSDGEEITLDHLKGLMHLGIHTFNLCLHQRLPLLSLKNPIQFDEKQQEPYLLEILKRYPKP